VRIASRTCKLKGGAPLGHALLSLVLSGVAKRLKLAPHAYLALRQSDARSAVIDRPRCLLSKFPYVQPHSSFTGPILVPPPSSCRIITESKHQ